MRSRPPVRPAGRGRPTGATPRSAAKKLAPDGKNESAPRALPSAVLRRRRRPAPAPGAQLPPAPGRGEGAGSRGSVPWQRSPAAARSSRRRGGGGALWGVSAPESLPRPGGRGARLRLCRGCPARDPDGAVRPTSAAAARGADGVRGATPTPRRGLPPLAPPAAGVFALQQRRWELPGTKLRASPARAQVGGGAAPGVGRAQGSGPAREAGPGPPASPRAHASGGGRAPGLRDLLARRPHALRAAGSAPSPAAAGGGAGAGARPARPSQPGGRESRDSSGAGASSSGRTRRLAVVRTRVTLGNKTRSGGVCGAYREPEPPRVRAAAPGSFPASVEGARGAGRPGRGPPKAAGPRLGRAQVRGGRGSVPLSFLLEADFPVGFKIRGASFLWHPNWRDLYGDSGVPRPLKKGGREELQILYIKCQNLSSFLRSREQSVFFA